MADQKRIRSAIDIGTNTVLLLIAEQTEQAIQPVFEQQRIPRLGKGVDADGYLSEESMNRVIDCLLEYKTFLETQFSNCEAPIITATSAVRDAANRQDFCETVKRKTGFDILILSGKQEAEWTYAGALSAVSIDSQKRYGVIDIGGGSTELGFGTGSILTHNHSFNMGSVRFTERFLGPIPTSQSKIEMVKTNVQELLNSQSELIHAGNEVELIGVAGTVTSLAFIAGGYTTYDAAVLNGSTLYLSQIQEWITQWKTKTAAELERNYPLVMKGRADIILAGLLILETCMEVLKKEKLTVSTGGIRSGALIMMK